MVRKTCVRTPGYECFNRFPWMMATDHDICGELRKTRIHQCLEGPTGQIVLIHTTKKTNTRFSCVRFGTKGCNWEYSEPTGRNGGLKGGNAL